MNERSLRARTRPTIGTWERSIEWEKGEAVHLTWVRPSGAHIVADLGDTIDRAELCRAIVAQAPTSMTLHLGEHKAFDDD